MSALGFHLSPTNVFKFLKSSGVIAPCEEFFLYCRRCINGNASTCVGVEHVKSTLVHLFAVEECLATQDVHAAPRVIFDFSDSIRNSRIREIRFIQPIVTFHIRVAAA